MISNRVTRTYSWVSEDPLTGVTWWQTDVGFLYLDCSYGYSMFHIVLINLHMTGDDSSKPSAQYTTAEWSVECRTRNMEYGNFWKKYKLKKMKYGRSEKLLFSAIWTIIMACDLLHSQIHRLIVFYLWQLQGKKWLCEKHGKNQKKWIG